MGFVGNYALCGLLPQTDGMPVIHAKAAGKFPAAFLQVFCVWLDQCFSQSPALFQSFIIRHFVADNAFTYQ